MTGPALPHVVVAVLTYKRPGDLAAALPLLVDQVRDASDLAGCEVLVVDNDPEASARATVEAWPDPEVGYAHEPTPGIAAARNRALDVASGADALVFIDDDERPSEHWLRLMVQTWRDGDWTGVVGPVVSEFAAEPTPWVAAGRFFDRRRLPTGTTVDVAATNNLLLDLPRLSDSGVRFDEDFGLSGGSDTLFTRQLVSTGHRLVWCDEAWVVDVVPEDRLTRGWVLRRAFRSGNSWSRTTLALSRGRGHRLVDRGRLLVPGTVRAVGGLGRLVLGLLSSSAERQARGARTLARGAGMTSGAFGYVYREYSRSRGRSRR
ncbi:glycosyltransferase family 2 protein [Solicola sp. PLA-1-18]|uniref:glycosyltransferase family 2 protein n=1 Tax=Solicola sp. PLA-1-18 TaxID=3380532 RepID=UPI003B7AEF20